jgi:hypothetical protein
MVRAVQTSNKKVFLSSPVFLTGRFYFSALYTVFVLYVCEVLCYRRLHRPVATTAGGLEQEFDPVEAEGVKTKTLQLIAHSSAHLLPTACFSACSPFILMSLLRASTFISAPLEGC